MWRSLSLPTFCATSTGRLSVHEASPMRCRTTRMLTSGVSSSAQRGAGAVLSAIGSLLASGGRRTAEELADADSSFVDVDGVTVHYKVNRASEGSPKETFAFAHGFGANLSTFDDSISTLLAARPASQSVAFDSPGFGLTSRPPLWRLDKYRMQFGADILDAVLPEPRKNPVVVGFSLGARTAVQYAVGSSKPGSQRPRPKALVLIAPGILPSKSMVPTGGPLALRLRRYWSYFAAVPLQCFKYFLVGISVLVNPILQLILRISISGVGFWVRGLKLARGDPETLTARRVESYRKPLSVRKWAVGILNFTRSMILERQSDVAGLPEGVRTDCGDIPVLVVHGNLDRIIPVANSEALVKAWPNATLAVMPGLGHVPHEEDPEKFVAILNKWLTSLELRGALRK